MKLSFCHFSFTWYDYLVRFLNATYNAMSIVLMNSQIFDQLLLKSQEQETKNVHYIVFDVIVGPFW